MEGMIISREHIKPSSPTPPHKRIHKLSLLDQILPPIYIPLVLYYPINPPKNIHNISEFISQTTQTLKQSLSKTLSLFYPLAGRIKDDLSIDCNDEGVFFVISKFNTALSNFLKNPNPQTCRAHIPAELITLPEQEPGSIILMIQVNFFECGAIAIGSVFFHRVADGITMANFTKSWAQKTTRNDDQSLESYFSPNYTARSFFPQNESMQSESQLYFIMKRYFKIGKTVMRRYVFDSSAITKLRDKLVADLPDSPKQGPTRFEIVSTLLWKCFMIARSARKSTPDPDGGNLVSLVSHVVNIRRRAESPFPENSFGNFVWLVPASSVNNEAHTDIKYLLMNVRSAISKMDADFVKRMQGDEGFSGYLKNLQDCWSEFPEKADYLSISSWCNFGLYGVDFGWGKPAWVSACNAGSDTESPFINVLLLMDTRQGDGIEAWLTMEEQFFPEFDKIQEIRDLASIDPSPLDINSANATK